MAEKIRWGLLSTAHINDAVAQIPCGFRAPFREAVFIAGRPSEVIFTGRSVHV